MTRAPFRSWVEDYVTPPQEQPIDIEAFRARAAQRTRTARLLDGRISKTRSYFRARYELAMAGNMQGEHADRERRATAPVEQARLHLQRRGLAVFAATVTGGPRGYWKISGRADLVDDQQLLDLARAKGWAS